MPWRRLVLALTLAGLVALVAHPEPVQHWLGVHLGLTNEASPWYAFWSGAAGELRDLVEVPVILALYAMHHNCHQHGCIRIRSFPDKDGWRWCRHHHPDLMGEHPTVERVTRAREDASG